MTLKTTHGGHYGKNMMDPGAVGNGYKEAEVAQIINKKIMEITGAKDASDFSASNINQNLANQVANMDKYAGADDLNISNHLNAFNGHANGVEVWYYEGDNYAKGLAEKMSSAIANATGLFNRGAKATTDLYVIRNSAGHTLLIEWAFIDNSSDMRKLMGNLDKAVNSAMAVLGYKVNNYPVVKNPNYYSDGNYFVALKDLQAMDKNWKKKDDTWLLKAGSKFAVRDKIINSKGEVHARVAGLDNTYVTLAKSHVKRQ